MAKHRIDPETTGHDWDGIQEWNNPLPRWWLWTFYVTIAWGLLYTLAFPAWPLLERATGGLLGWSSRDEVAADIAAVEASRAGMMERLAQAGPEGIEGDPELLAFAQDAGAAVFRANCATCHGAGAGGLQAAGFPSLLDDDWLWGGTAAEIHATVAHGIRNADDPEARWSEMPAFGDMLSNREVEAVVAHVLAISGQEADMGLAAEGAGVFADNCAGCHGEGGTGDRALGAPDLTDAVWLYGGTPERIAETVREARFGVMPAWGEAAGARRALSEGEIAAVAAYVHSLGGGE